MNLPVEFVCPLCKGPLETAPDAYTCPHHPKTFRIIYGIPDFRVFPDPYISIEAEDQKAARIMAEYPTRTFEQLVEFYYRITPEVPPDLAQKYMRHVFSSVARGQGALAEIQQNVQSSLALSGGASRDGGLLEIGSGTGGLLIAAAPTCEPVVGVDIALRWLVIAKKRLEEASSPALLICACAEYLPFRDGSYQVMIASDVIEHTHGQVELMREAHRVLTADGVLFLATPNRWCPTPDPHMKVWGLGFLPKPWRDSYVRLVRRVPYQHISTLNYFDVRRVIRQANFKRWRILLPDIHPAPVSRLSAWERAALPIYRRLKNLTAVKWLVYLFGPLFHVICFKS